MKQVLHMNRLQQTSLDLIKEDRRRKLRPTARERWSLWKPFLRFYKRRNESRSA
ncbi:MAG: hypothetical protein AB8G17_10645 [Gammaproteobacteria bacterium]